MSGGILFLFLLVACGNLVSEAVGAQEVKGGMRPTGKLLVNRKGGSLRCCLHVHDNKEEKIS